MSYSKHLHDKAGRHIAEIIPNEFMNSEALTEGILAHDGIMPVDMKTVRDFLSRNRRLGKHVTESIEAMLQSMGFGWLPIGSLPQNQNAIVCLYRLDGPISKLQEALRDPASSADAVKLLRSIHGFIEESEDG